MMGDNYVTIDSTKRGGSDKGHENEYFTVAVLGSVILSIVAWIGVVALECPILTFFGADDALLALAQRYMQPLSAL